MDESCEMCMHYGQYGEPCPLTYCYHETAKHTPGPVRNDRGTIRPGSMNDGSPKIGQVIAECHVYDQATNRISGAERDRNAEFIYQAFATFDDLADAARGFIDYVFGADGGGGRTPDSIQARGWAIIFKDALEGKR